ncbi:MAG TPA: hypothetical protein DCL26_12295 [Alteromonas australica]|uniref:DUF3530 domain-containing protein n=2 Tax=Alteromonas australica TaxID=589873 RepID=A0A358E3T3_9ALTE|nr:hypothetical protein [Alteromonas sp.]MBU34592.1 hypothetical protein [Alteromonas sp.]HAI73097.1 hypothetical protein [Alteromonas australica]HAU26462.1 hypothetical protein [Alteromonas australica]HBU52873.1 hypothetical protein [Alteromonas australica]
MKKIYRYNMVRSFRFILAFLIASAFCKMSWASFYSDISNAFLPNELSQLMVGDTAVPIFDIPASTPLSRGVVYILADQSSNELNLTQSKALAESLSEKGWHCIVSPIPLILGNPVWAENTSEDAKGESSGAHPRIDSRSTQLDYQASAQHLVVLLNALDNYSQGHQGFRVIVSQGMTAAQVLDLGAQEKIAAPSTLVTLSPFWPEAQINRAIPDVIASTSFPVLDLSLPNVNAWAHQTASKRRHKAATSLKLHYRQQSIPAQISTFSLMDNDKPPYIHILSGHIIGWTRYLGW